ncbi:MAG: Lrp/AsnC family transcriptional regulator [Methanobacteriota archaeon]|nr:MAG: Lrp/AsnC family transcriptional regulator [Euryarchaeota archaeon]
MITNEERRLIQYLQKFPMATFVEVADFLGITPPTAKRKFLQLTNGQTGIIKNVVAKPKLSSLEMKKWTCILTFESWKQLKKQLSNLYEFALDHPYTAYINQLYGSKNGVILQFNIPMKGEREFAEALKLIEAHTKSEVLQFKDEMFHFQTEINLGYWGEKNWEFNVDSWFAADNNNVVWENEHQTRQDPTLIFKRMRMDDIIIIREMMINSRRKHTEIIEDINSSDDYSEEEKSPFTQERRRQVSRRFEFIERHGIIEDYELLFDKRYLGIDHFLIYTGHIEKEYVKRLMNRIMDPEFPFYSQLRILEDGTFYWLLHIPPSLISEMTRFVFSISSTFEVLHLDTKPENSYTFPIWHRNFVPKEGWKVGSEWMGIEFVKRHFKIN